jgi:hypothetical protein
MEDKMKLPISLNYIKTLFTRALESVGRNLEIHMPSAYKAPKKDKTNVIIKPRKMDGQENPRAKGSGHSESQIYNHPRKDIPSIHEKH